MTAVSRVRRRLRGRPLPSEIPADLVAEFAAVNAEIDELGPRLLALADRQLALDRAYNEAVPDDPDLETFADLGGLRFHFLMADTVDRLGGPDIF